MKTFFKFLCVVVFFNAPAQNKASGIDVCLALKGFSSSSEAESALDRIIATVGISKNFVMQECTNMPNAAALQVEGVRYIFYNQKWMSTIDNSSFGNLFILAHEVGHHVNGHTLDWVLLASKAVNKKTLSESRVQELEADEFAGFVLAKLGASLNETSEVINNVTDDSDDSYSTHPSRSKRLLAIKKGFEKGANSTVSNYNTKDRIENHEVILFADGSRWEGPSEEYMPEDSNDGSIADDQRVYRPNGKGIMYELDGSVYKGNHNGGYKTGYGEMLYTNGDLYKGYWLNDEQSGRGQLIKPNGVIIVLVNGVNESDIEAEKYFNAGINKEKSKDYIGAILDYTKAISLNPNYDLAYSNRAYSKLYSNDFTGALQDFDKAIQLNPNNIAIALLYKSRAAVKEKLKDYKGAIDDVTKSIDFKIDDTNNEKSIKFSFRAYYKFELKDFEGAIKDYTNAIELNPKNILAYCYRGYSKSYLGDDDKAIADLNKAIAIDSNSSLAYYIRGNIKENIGEISGACEDWNRASQMGSEYSGTLITKYCK